MLLSSVSFNAAFADDNSVITVYVNNIRIEFDVNPITESDRTLVPLRAIFEALGAEVSWNDESQTAIAVKDADTLNITIDSKILYKNGTPIELDVPARMVGDRTLVPVRAVSESFNADVDWDEDTQRVIINTPIEAPSTVPEASATPTASDSQEIIVGDGLNYNTLSENDLEKLKQAVEVIRYQFEQSSLPQFAFEYSDDIYDMIYDKDKNEELKSQIYNQWYRTVASKIIELQINSKDNYIIDSSFTDDINSSQNYYDIYKDIIDKAEFNAEKFISDIRFAVTNDKKYALVVVEFKNADSLVQSKYLSIVDAKNDSPRFYTAENDIMMTESWFFCQVTQSGRRTITMFDKNSESLDTFIEYSFGCYDDEVSSQKNI